MLLQQPQEEQNARESDLISNSIKSPDTEGSATPSPSETTNRPPGSHSNRTRFNHLLCSHRDCFQIRLHLHIREEGASSPRPKCPARSRRVREADDTLHPDALSLPQELFCDPLIHSSFPTAGSPSPGITRNAVTGSGSGAETSRQNQQLMERGGDAATHRNRGETP
ncbi:hypothetical protein AAFF_G00295090 [Aldrovandia affinis]|uniref:Uncharacterized protein n=1 Tax=Aldrovandia affinis TaxID=143900 RepID=A0AAD7W0L4_9TELE|nr:hypothetical protein AAFF_G00295090 [Aldrovandia affinis]